MVLKKLSVLIYLLKDYIYLKLVLFIAKLQKLPLLNFKFVISKNYFDKKNDQIQTRV